MSWLFLSLLAVGFWSVGMNVTKKGLSHVSSLWTNIIGNVFRLLIWVPVALLLSKGQIRLLDPVSFGLLVAAGACFMSLYYSISKGSVSLVVAMAGLSPLITTLWTVFVTHQALTVSQTVGIGVILIGTLFVANIFQHRVQNMTWLWWGLGSALLIGTGDYLSSRVSIRLGSYNSLFWLCIVMQFYSLLNYLIDKPGRVLPKISRATVSTTVFGQVIMWTGSLAYFLALGLGSAALVSSIGGVYIAGVALVSMIWFKEKLSVFQYIGIALCTVGVWVIAAQ